MAKRILDPGPLSPSSGLFLASARGTGKSTFVQEDLIPALRQRGSLVLYADLSANRRLDPAEAISGALRAVLKQDGRVLRTLATTVVAPFEVDNVGLGRKVTLARAFAALSEEVKKPISLILDEAQDAISTPDGSNTMFALKATRDELNSSSYYGFRLVAVGSDRAELSMMCRAHDQAFFLAELSDFPVLGREYVGWFCSNAGLPLHLDVNSTFRLFVEGARRPAVLAAGLAGAADAARLGLDHAAIHSRFEAAVREQIASCRTTSALLAGDQHA